MPSATRHILGLSGGKDSSALAIYLRDRVPQMEYVFCDTGKELPRPTSIWPGLRPIWASRSFD